MAQPFSRETQTLFDRADRAIEESRRLKKERKKAIARVWLTLHHLDKHWPSIAPSLLKDAGE